MIRLFFVLLTLVSAVAVLSSAILQACFIFAGLNVPLDDLFIIYVLALSIGLIGGRLTNEN